MNIQLLQLLKEILNESKAIIMAGGAGSGKSTLIKELSPYLKDYKIINPDNYVEDKNSPFYNNVLRASSQVDDKDVPEAISKGENFIWDTTAANAAKLFGGEFRRKPISGLVNDASTYKFMMIMVYAHPIVSFLRNFKRERRLPGVAVLSTWNSVYKNIKLYKEKLGDNFILYRAPDDEFEKEIEAFEKAASTGKLKEYFHHLHSEDSSLSSSFKKDDSNLSPEEIAKLEKSREKSNIKYEEQIQQLETIFKEIQEQIKGNIKTKEEIANKIKQF